MFNVGGGELLAILLIALIVLGPDRLPGAVRQAGQWVGELRKISSGFQNEIRSAFDEHTQVFDAIEPDLTIQGLSLLHAMATGEA